MTPGPQRTLSNEDVVDAAFEVLMDRGFSSLSVRGVAAAVGLTPAAIYTYFPNRDALLKAMVERIIGRIDLVRAADDSLPWANRMREIALNIRAGLDAPSGAVGLIMNGPLDGPNALRFSETLLSLFAEAGLSDADCARASYSFQVYVLGFIALESADQEPDTAAHSEDARAKDRLALLEHLDGNSYPRTVLSADVIARYNTTDQFLWGLDRLLGGLTSQ